MSKREKAKQKKTAQPEKSQDPSCSTKGPACKTDWSSETKSSHVHGKPS